MSQETETAPRRQVHVFVRGRCLTCDTRLCSALGGESCPCCGRRMTVVREVKLDDPRMNQGI